MLNCQGVILKENFTTANGSVMLKAGQLWLLCEICPAYYHVSVIAVRKLICDVKQLGQTGDQTY